jgi:DNA-directed RNA polymerase subunit RPC12/RpoP
MLKLHFPGENVTQDLLAVAKQGDAHAIARLINRSLQPKGITAKVVLRDGCLKVMLESESIPDRQIAEYVYRGIDKLDVPSIQRLAVFGRQTGDEFPAWTEEFNLNLFDSLASEAIPSPEQVELADSGVQCPQCKSSQVMVSKKGFGVGKAAAGALLLGPVGLAGGMIGSNKAMLSCLKCGHQWQPTDKPESPKTESPKPEPPRTESPKVISMDRSTPAKLKIPTVEERIIGAIGMFFMLGIAGALLSLIPIFGWILGPILLFAAIIAPFPVLFGDSLKALVGKCPYCHKAVEVSPDKKTTECTHCKGEIVVKNERFYAVEE